MSQFPEISSNLSTANFRASVLTALQSIYTNASQETQIQTASIATTTGSLIINTSDVSTLAFSTSPATSGTITILGSVDGVNYLNTSYIALTSGGSSASFNAAVQTIGQINTVGVAYIKFLASNLVGTISITSVGSLGVSNVMLDNSIPAGANVIGSVSVQDVSGVLLMANGTATLTSAAVTAFTATKSLSIQNTSTYILYISTTTPATSANSIVLSAGTIYRFPYVPTNQLYCLGTNAATTYNLWYA